MSREKATLPNWVTASGGHSASPSRRRLFSLTIACGAIFALYSFTAPSSSVAPPITPSTNLSLGEDRTTSARPEGPSSGHGDLHEVLNAWSSWRPWSSNSNPAVAGSSLRGPTAPGRHDSEPSALSGGFVHDTSKWESPTKPLPLTATLRERLDSWEKAPLPEPAEWVQFNLKTCPDNRVGKNGNYDLLKKSHLLWASMNSTHVYDKRHELITFMREAEAKGDLSPSKWGSGRGLVFTAGNADTFVRVLLTLRMFREHIKSDLPAEIFSFPGEEPDQVTREALEAVNATLKIVEGAKRDTKRTKNFHIKASALVQCSFREPLYLDSDNLPVILEDGAFDKLWEAKSYKKLGVMFWPDYWKTMADIPIWLLIGTQCRDEWEQEAGQIVVDKSKHLDMLLLSEYMLKDWQYWFNLSDGDKDVFRFAMLALRKRWGLPGRYLGAGGLSWNTISGYCGQWHSYGQMLQHDAAGRPLFSHMNLLKQIPSGISRGTTFKRTRSVKIITDGDGEEKREHLKDWGVEADMLANAQADGTAIIPAPGPVRRRAALERGLRPFLHGGSVSAVCADVAWGDPRSDDEVAEDADRWFDAHPQALEGEEKEEGKTTPDLEYTVAKDGLKIQWRDPVETLQWNDDPRLQAFEDRFFDGRPNNGPGILG